MIAQLTGKFLHKTPTQLIVDAGGVGYEVNISLNTYTAIQSQESGTLFTYLKISEDAHTLWGFAEMAEKQMFILLIGVSGVGAGTARMMLSSLRPQDVQQTIMMGDAKRLEAVKGIGKKTAERLVLELRDKVGKHAINLPNLPSSYNTNETDALEALVALGIARPMAETAIRKAVAVQTHATVEDLIKQVLKSI
jgi:Holliday junction DNA helicase RuvA